MAIDRAWLKRAEESPQPLTLLRLYRWRAPTVSLGEHQQIEHAVDAEYCNRNSIPIVWRPSGGRAVYHDCELTYAVVSNDCGLFPIGCLKECYRKVAEFLTAGFRQLGLVVELASSPIHRVCSSPNHRTIPCFVSPSRDEILFAGKKLVGSAQRQQRRSFLQHGSIPLRVDYRSMARALKFDEMQLRSSMVSVSEASGRDIRVEEMIFVLKQAFEAHFSVKLVPEAAAIIAPASLRL